MMSSQKNSILAKIIKRKKEEISQTKQVIPLSVMKDQISGLPPTRPFRQRLRRQKDVALIAEIKRKSPSKGIIREDFSVPAISRAYTRAGAEAISVLTDRNFFGGDPGFIKVARENSNLPILCKEFIIDPYQIYQARLLGADAILLIIKILTPPELKYFINLAQKLGLEALVETSNAGEIKQAIEAGAKIIGINNRDLDTFQTDLYKTLSLRRKITSPEITVVSESGINSHRDMKLLADNKVHAALVGEALMRKTQLEKAVRELIDPSSDKEVC
jgi:indole-3-glycerol phosphate synthase